jgi:hypothetical protein
MKNNIKKVSLQIFFIAGLFAIITGINVFTSYSANISLSDGETFYFSSPSSGLVVFQGDSLVVASKSAAPATPHTGQIYFDTGASRFKGYDGTSWNNLNGKRFQKDTVGTLTKDLVAYWKMNEGASLSRNDFWDGHDLFQTNYPVQASGKLGNAASFNGSSQFLNAGNDSAFDNPTNFSVAFWIKTGGQGSGSHKIISKHNANDDGWVIQINGSAGDYQNKIWIVMQDQSVNVLSRFGSTSLNDNQWHFVVVTRTGQTLAIYIDNVAETLSEGGGSTGTVGNMSNNGEVTVGRRSEAQSQYLSGTLDEFGFWTKVLSSQERADLYNSGSGQTMVN